MSQVTNSPSSLVKEIQNALQSVKFGSVEIFVQDSIVTQITIRNIRKTSVGVNEPQENSASAPIGKAIRTRSKIRINLHS